MRTTLSCALALIALTACSAPEGSRPAELRVAAASNLARVMPELERASGMRLAVSYGSTAQLARQIENGAPLDVFLAADTQHVDELAPQSRLMYASGRLVVWAPHRPDLRSLRDLDSPGVSTIAMAKPELAPYGEAAVETLHVAGLWDKLEKKIVFSSNIMAAKQLADTGNADAVFTALSLVYDERSNFFAVDTALYKPIDQAACVTKQAQDRAAAQRFLDFLASPKARDIFRRFGYGVK